jgi:ParB/RepB/Spo0J family partition protein
MKTELKTQRWPIERLKDHPRQASLFGDLSDAELDALAEDMKENGLQTPVEILSTGVIVAGHQRVRAARRLGWRDIDVVVRADLENEGPEAVEQRLVSDNLIRRQLGPLGRARCIAALLEIAMATKTERMDVFQKEKLKASIAKQLGVSIRSVNRYLLVLRTPRAVQNSFDEGNVSLVTAGRIALLDQDDQRRIAERIARGEKASAVAAAFLKKPQPPEPTLNDVLFQLVEALRIVLPRVRGRVPELRRELLHRWLPELQEGNALLKELLAEAQAGDAEEWNPSCMRAPKTRNGVGCGSRASELGTPCPEGPGPVEGASPDQPGRHGP